jgi:hypothetical protein
MDLLEGLSILRCDVRLARLEATIAAAVRPHRSYWVDNIRFRLSINSFAPASRDRAFQAAFKHSCGASAYARFCSPGESGEN